MNVKMKLKCVSVYNNMLRRCYDENNAAYKNYGARGVYVSKSWLTDATSFIEWYESKYEGNEDCDLDRIDVDGPYSEENCRLISRKENNRNRRNTRFAEIYGEIKSWGEWTEDPRCATTYHSFFQRMELGWEPKRALTTPVNDHVPLYTAFGESKSAAEWEKDERCSVSAGTIWYRSNSGWSDYDAISLPSARNSGILHDGRSILEISKDADCEVSYNTLAARLKSGESVEQAKKKRKTPRGKNALKQTV